jgi:hypothetical protein
MDRRFSPRPGLCRFAAVAIVIAAGSAGLAMPGDAVCPDEIREHLTDLQYIPTGELPRAELEIDAGARVARGVTQAEAIEDVEHFFYLLSHGWCGYEYFRKNGGSIDPFVEAEQALLERLREKPRWSSRVLSELIHEHLDFVYDCHLILNDEPFCEHRDFWFDPRIELREEGGAWRFTLNGKPYTLLEVDGAQPEPFLFRSLDVSGREIRMLGTIAGDEPAPLTLIAQGAHGEVRLQSPLSRSDRFRGERFAVERIGGVPVIRVRSFADYYGRELETFLDTAEEYRGEPYVILDIRGNRGGNTRWPRRWISAFTGGYPRLSQALTELVSRTTMTGRANLFALLVHAYRKEESSFAQAEHDRFRAAAARFDEPGAKPYWSEIYVPVLEPIPNKTTLIVIQDRRVASAGEGVISYLSDQVENVVFVGENTKGALTFGQQSAHHLPNSKMLAYLPIKLNVPLDLEVREETGFKPDYWIPAPQALNHAIAAVRAGTIPTRAQIPDGYFDVEFVPERPPPWWHLERRDRVLVVIFLGVGIVFGVANRKQKRTVYLIAGVFALALGAGYVYFSSQAGYALGAVGVAYLLVGLVKRPAKS